MTDLRKIGGPIEGGRGHVQGMVRQKPADSGRAPGTAAGDSNISDAVAELNGQHPQKWHDLGPHHHENWKKGRD